MKKLITIVVIVAVVGAGAAFFFLTPGMDTQNVAGIGPAAGAEGFEKNQSRKLPVKVTTAVSGTVQQYIRLSGDVTAASSINVFPDTTGKLSEVLVSTGDYIKKEQPVAKVDPSRPGANYALSPVEAPITGTVTDVLADIGENVSTSAPVVQIGQLDKLEINTFVSEKYVNKIKLWQRALIATAALPGTVINGYISEIAPVLNSKTRTLETTISFSKQPQGIKAGMLVEIILIIEEHSDTVKIPQEAVQNPDSSPFVFVVDDNKTRLREITTGITVDGIVEVTEGLEAGDTVVVSGTTLIADGMAVSIISEKAPLPKRGNVEGAGVFGGPQ